MQEGEIMVLLIACIMAGIWIGLSKIEELLNRAGVIKPAFSDETGGDSVIKNKT